MVCGVGRLSGFGSWDELMPLSNHLGSGDASNRKCARTRVRLIAISQQPITDSLWRDNGDVDRAYACRVMAR
jgi:hypothetical protein